MAAMLACSPKVVVGAHSSAVKTRKPVELLTRCVSAGETACDPCIGIIIDGGKAALEEDEDDEEEEGRDDENDAASAAAATTAADDDGSEPSYLPIIALASPPATRRVAEDRRGDFDGGGSPGALLKDLPLESEARGVLPDRRPLIRLAASCSTCV